MRRRLGVSGSGRSETLELLRGVVPVDTECSPPPAFERLFDELLLARVAAAVPERGDTKRLSQIAGWGAAACWITAEPDTEDVVYAAAGAFNLAVAVFDSVLDRGPERSAALVGSLAPPHLARVLNDPERQRFEPVGSEHEPVTELFHVALAGFVGRWGNDRGHMSLALDLLSTMYRSEVGESDDPMPAKALPSAFLGLMGTNDPAHIDMHRALGRFLAAWDDWMDLDEDLLGFRPNRYLGNPQGWNVMCYLVQAVKLVASSRAHRPVRSDLRRQLQATIHKAMALDHVARSRTLGFVEALLR
ncbi:MAG: hypothetical protein P1T08_08075 [Acidimicrobiia bacterium]|nr:hypothetical protein [Acidimicrobiia bacterium]